MYFFYGYTMKGFDSHLTATCESKSIIIYSKLLKNYLLFLLQILLHDNIILLFFVPVGK